MYISFICVKSLPLNSVNSLVLMLRELEQDDISFHYFPHRLLKLEQDAILFHFTTDRISVISLSNVIVIDCNQIEAYTLYTYHHVTFTTLFKNNRCKTIIIFNFSHSTERLHS